MHPEMRIQSVGPSQIFSVSLRAGHSCYPAHQDLRPMAHRFLASLLALFTICPGLIAQPANVYGQSSTAPQSTNPTTKSGVTIQLAAPPQAPAQNARTGAPGDEKAALAMADRLLASGKPAEAQAKYQAIVNVDPDSVPAQVGVVRALFIQQKLD